MFSGLARVLGRMRVIGCSRIRHWVSSHIFWRRNRKLYHSWALNCFPRVSACFVLSAIRTLFCDARSRDCGLLLTPTLHSFTQIYHCGRPLLRHRWRGLRQRDTDLEGIFFSLIFNLGDKLKGHLVPISRPSWLSSHCKSVSASEISRAIAMS